MRPVWLPEGNVDGLDAEPLKAEIRRQGMTAVVVKFLTHLDDLEQIDGPLIVTERRETPVQTQKE